MTDQPASSAAYKPSSPTGNCWGFEDGLDGFVVHDPECRHAGLPWIGGGQDCIGYRTWQGVWPSWAK